MSCRECRYGTMRGVDLDRPYSGRFRCAKTGNEDALSEHCSQFEKGKTQFITEEGRCVRKGDIPWMRKA